jgi:hypothetical protein
LKQQKIYYWSPFLSSIATSKAVINSANSLMKYEKNYKCFIMNFFGEFNGLITDNKVVQFFITFFNGLLSPFKSFKKK